MIILVINGPNLNLLGEREPEIYGNLTLSEINEEIRKLAGELQVSVNFFQSNHEGFIIDHLHEFRKIAHGVIINPGALTHYSYALRDAITGCQLPTVEVHLSDIQNREDFRKTSVVQPACIHQISGKGLDSYLEGLQYLVTLLKNQKSFL